jgi:hypothetical protein
MTNIIIYYTLLHYKIKLPIMTCISHSINFLTTSRPIPRAPPVTTATFPRLFTMSKNKNVNNVL